MENEFDDWERGLSDRGRADLEEALLVARGGGLVLQNVEYGTDELVFVFNRDLKSIDEGWRHLFGVGATAATDPNAALWYTEHPEMAPVAKSVRREGARLIITDGLRFAYAQLREELKQRHGFVRALDSDLGDAALAPAQQDFAACFDKRFDRAAFVKCLQDRARNKWQYIEQSGQIIAGIIRESSAERHEVTPLDRTRVLAVLEGWAEDATYMDNGLFDTCLRYRPKEAPYVTTPFTTERCEHISLTVGDVETALKLLTMPGVHGGSYQCTPTPGALMGVAEVFEKSEPAYVACRSHYRIFGNQLGTEVPDVNRYFSTLLEWDTRHCYGLLLQLRKAKIFASQGGGELSTLQEAAWQWLRSRARDSDPIYRRYNLQDDSEGFLEDVEDLSYENFP